ncbi:TlpA disulfide reductase family protein [Micromonospora violae]|uniref:TlpA disulfide reductase family protein n=1 Tax=Micromonospora violae TaxID=1278207 RepID=UPI0033F2F606
MRHHLRGIPRAAIALILFAATSTACNSNKPARYIEVQGGIPLIDAQSRPVAPPASGEVLDGTRISAEDYRGHVTVLNFWASWCSPCRLEAKDLNSVSRETKSLGVKFLGINIQDSRSKAQAFEQTSHSNYPSIFDPSGRVALEYQGQIAGFTPTTLIIDAKGRLAAIVNGPIQKETLLSSVRYVSMERP